jgi:hypothetical protein
MEELQQVSKQIEPGCARPIHDQGTHAEAKLAAHAQWLESRLGRLHELRAQLAAEASSVSTQGHRTPDQTTELIVPVPQQSVAQ